MSEVAMGARAVPGERVFRPLTVALLLALGVLGFVGTLVLGAYGPDLRSGRNGGAHALSNAATGYAGIVGLARATGRDPRVIRADRQLIQAELVVLTPERGRVPVGDVMAARQYKRTLMVLPKWATVADEDKRGWVHRTGPLDASEPEGVLAPGTALTVRRRPAARPVLQLAAELPRALRFRAPLPVQVVTGGRDFAALEPLLTDGAGGIVLGKFRNRPLYLLAEPDLLANHGIRELDRARAAMAMLDWLAGGRADRLAFDVTLNGLGQARSVLKLPFEPPLLAMTLAIAAALALIGWRAATRFGAAATPARAIAFGKRALVDNTAALVTSAGREGRLGARYADAVRMRARERFGTPAALGPDAGDAWLDRIGRGTRFGELAAATARARGRSEVLAAATRLHEWMGNRTK